MNKTQSVSIGRRNFVCEEHAYSLLEKYIARSTKALDGDPDKEEILEDLESALAAHLSEATGELVVDEKVARRVIESMGEVESEQSEQTKASDEPERSWREQFKTFPARDKSRGIIAGVCAGFARRWSIDPWWLRLALVVLTIVTEGAFIIVYIILAFLMEGANTPRRAEEIASEVRKQRVPEAMRRVETTLSAIVRFIAKTIRFSVLALLFVAVLGIAIAWSIGLFYLLSNPDKVILFGSSPTWVDVVGVISSGIVVLAPLIILISSMVNSSILKRPRFMIAGLSIWFIALLSAIGSIVNIVPNVRDRLVRDEPQTRHVYVETYEGQLNYLCLTLWGDCRENQLQLTQRDMCGVQFDTVETGDFVQFSALSERGWSTRQQGFIYPASKEKVCDFLKNLREQAADQIVVEYQPIDQIDFKDTTVYYTEETPQRFGITYFVR